MVLETKKSHNLLAIISWRTKEAGRIIHSESKGLRTKGARGVSPRVQRPRKQELRRSTAEVAGCLSSRKRLCPSSAVLFHLSPQRIRQCAHVLLRVDLFTKSTESNANCFQKHLDRHIQN